jgi:hypothetical protein
MRCPLRRGTSSETAAACRGRALRGFTRRHPGRGECGPPSVPGPSCRAVDARDPLALRAPTAGQSGRCGPSHSMGDWRRSVHCSRRSRQASIPSSTELPTPRQGPGASAWPRRSEALQRPPPADEARRRRRPRAARRLAAKLPDVENRASARSGGSGVLALRHELNPSRFDDRPRPSAPGKHRVNRTSGVARRGGYIGGTVASSFRSS